MRSRRILFIASALLLSFSSIALEAQVSKPCIAADEPIYIPGADGVNPPQKEPDKNAKNAPKIRGAISLELVVNGEGHVCRVRVLAARDKTSAQQTADYIAQHWTFKPATKQGKSVAVIFRTDFGVARF